LTESHVYDVIDQVQSVLIKKSK